MLLVPAQFCYIQILAHLPVVGCFQEPPQEHNYVSNNANSIKTRRATPRSIEAGIFMRRLARKY